MPPTAQVIVIEPIRAAKASYGRIEANDFSETVRQIIPDNIARFGGYYGVIFRVES